MFYINEKPKESTKNTITFFFEDDERLIIDFNGETTLYKKVEEEKYEFHLMKYYSWTWRRQEILSKNQI